MGIRFISYKFSRNLNEKHRGISPEAKGIIMKKSILCMVIVILFFCVSMGRAAENVKQEDLKGNSETDTIKPPTVLNSVMPGYPMKAEMDRVEGFVIIKFVVTKMGDVKNPEILESVPPDYFESATINALKAYKFKPAIQYGVPVDYTLEWPFVFSFPDTSSTGDIDSRLQAYRFASKGNSLINKAEYRKAADEISEAIKLEPKFNTAYYYRSLAYMKMEKYDRAISDIDRAIEMAPEVFGYYNHRGLIYLFNEDYQKAIEDFDKSIAIEPKNIVAYIYRGDAYRQSKKYQEAINDYTSALEFDNTLIHVHNNRGYTYYKVMDNHNACMDFKKACELGDCRALEHLQMKGVCPSDISGSDN